MGSETHPLGQRPIKNDLDNNMKPLRQGEEEKGEDLRDGTEGGNRRGRGQLTKIIQTIIKTLDIKI